MANSEYVVTVGIDLGTFSTGSAYAFYNTPTKCHERIWRSDPLITLKLPTSVLFGRDEKPLAFGYEAEDMFADVLEDGEESEYYFFDRFMNTLVHTQMITNTTAIKDNTGKSMEAIKVVSSFLNFVKEDILAVIDRRVKGVEGRCQFILTVPASWDENNTQFVVESMEKTGTKRESIFTVSEPAAALQYYNSLRNEWDRPLEASKGHEVEQILVVDIGGEATKLTVMETRSDQEIYQIARGEIPCGAECVDRAFFDILLKIFSREVLYELRTCCPLEYNDICREFKYTKCRMSSKRTKQITVTMPVVCLEKLTGQWFGEDCRKLIENSPYRHIIDVVGDEFKIEYECFRLLFTETNNNIVEFVQNSLAHPQLKGVCTVLVVGGHARCELFQDQIRRTLKKSVNIFIPEDSVIAATKGAVLYGNKQIKVTVSKSQLVLLGTDEPKKFHESNSILFRHLPVPGDKTKFTEVIAKGTYQSFDNRVYLAGPCMAGKSSLASIFIGEEIPKSWISTNGLSIFFGRNGINLKTKKMIPLFREKMEQVSIDKSGLITKLLQGNLAVQTKTENDRDQTKEIQLKKNDQQNKPINKTNFDGVTKHDEAKVRPIENKVEEIKMECAENVHLTHAESHGRSRRHSIKESHLKRYRQTEESLHKEILDKIRRGMYEMDIAPSDLVDFGGQRCFDMTHQLFIQHKGTFVLLFDGSKGLRMGSDQPDILAIDTFVHWVNSVLLCCGFGDDKMPVILFGATHKDGIPEDQVKKKRQEYISELTKAFSDHKHHTHIRYNDLFFINATDPRDPEIERLQDTLVEIAFSQPTWGQRMPVAWVPLEMSITECRSSGSTILRKMELVDLNKINEDLAMSGDQMEYFLRVQHSLGKLMYFNQPGLNEFVIIQPTTMVNILRSFVTDEMFWPNDGRAKSIYDRLRKTGIIRKEDLYIIWSKEPFSRELPTVDHKDFVIQLLLHLDILVEPKSVRHTAGIDCYLVPCMVKETAPNDLLCNRNLIEKSIHLCYHLKNVEVPSALAFKVIGAVTSIWTLKEIEKKSCIYFQAAVLNVDEENELRIVMKENRILVCLVNKSSKHLLSPDVAASIQECLTLALTRVIEFYQRSFGNYRPGSDISSLYEMEVGEICRENRVCTIDLHSAKTTKEWKCDNDCAHSTKCVLYWIFKKNKTECHPLPCMGPSKDLLVRHLSDKHLVRLAKLFGIRDFEQFIIYLGLTRQEWEDIEYQFQGSNVVGKKLMALIRWKQKNESKFQHVCLQDTVTGIESVANIHVLCQILREDMSLVDVANRSLQEEPTTQILKQLSTKMGNCVIQLGIELGLSIGDVENVMYSNPRSLHDQLYFVMKKWTNLQTTRPTIYKLLGAVQRCESGGFSFLLEQFNVKSSS